MLMLSVTLTGGGCSRSVYGVGSGGSGFFTGIPTSGTSNLPLLSGADSSVSTDTSWETFKFCCF